MVKIDNKFFGDFNPYVEIVQGDWLLNTYGMDHHLGEVYLNGDSLYEVGKLSDVSDENPLGRANDKVITDPGKAIFAAFDMVKKGDSTVPKLLSFPCLAT